MSGIINHKGQLRRGTRLVVVAAVGVILVFALVVGGACLFFGKVPECFMPLAEVPPPGPDATDTVRWTRYSEPDGSSILQDGDLGLGRMQVATSDESGPSMITYTTSPLAHISPDSSRVAFLKVTVKCGSDGNGHHGNGYEEVTGVHTIRVDGSDRRKVMARGSSWTVSG